MNIDGREIDISNRNKVFFPEASLTKGDLIDYYHALADILVPHLRGRGITLQRFPDGLQGKGFYQKDTPDYFPDWIQTVTVPKREGGSYDAPVVDSPATVVYLANQAVLTMHLYLSPAKDLEHPDLMVYDLDPPEGTQDFSAVQQAALDVRGVLGELGLEAWVQTTGSKGFHVVVPLDGGADFDEVHEFARTVALLLVRRDEDKYTLKQRKKNRRGRIFLDTLRNSYGATAVAPYSVRARPGATVATPVTWAEVEAGASPRDWTMQNIFDRVEQEGDAWADLHGCAQSTATCRERLSRLLEQEVPAQEEGD
jgi:bifunctional non-homologous end joining protein LigD